MDQNFEFHTNKTVIPEYLLPLPRVKFEIYRKYRKNYVSPPSLLELCCAKLETINCRNFPGDNWQDFQDIFQLSSKVATKSYKTLCHIDNPIAATQYVIHLAKTKKLSISGLMKRIKTDQVNLKINRNKLENHWDRMIPAQKFPYLLIGKTNRK